MTNDTVPATRQCEARRLSAGDKVAAGFLPLRGSAEILFACPYVLNGVGRVLVVYLYDGDGQPQPDDFLADALIPVADARPAPTAPCGCLHYLGQQIATCQGPHTRGDGPTLRWAPTN